jgi:hypothetical protein
LEVGESGPGDAEALGEPSEGDEIDPAAGDVVADAGELASTRQFRTFVGRGSL